MNLITTIDEFKLKYDDAGIFFIKTNTLSEDVLEYYAENYNVYWSYISLHQTLSEQFIIKYNDKVDWYSISRCQTLTETFITKYNDKVDWVGLFTNKKTTLSYEFIVSHLYKFNLYRVNIGIKNNDNIDRLIKEYPEKYRLDKIAYVFNK